MIRRELTRRVGPAGWEVRLTATPRELEAGRLRAATARGRHLRTRGGLVISDLALGLQNLRIDPASGSLEEVGGNLLTIGLDAEALTRFMRERAGGELRNARVAVHSGKIHLKGARDLGILRVPVRVTGVPALHNNQIHFVMDRASVARLRVPQGQLRRFQRRINPIADLCGLEAPATLLAIRIEGDRLVAHARLNFEGPMVAAGD